MSGPAPARAPLTPSQIRLVRLAGAASVSVAVALVLLKIFAYAATGSIALLSSLADSVLDLLASSITLFAVRFALEPADREHRFGHGKLEAIAGLVQSCVILGSAGYVAYRAVGRLLAPVVIEAPGVGTAVMLVSLVLTIVLVLFQQHVIRQTGSIAIGADELHYKADVLTNVAVLIAIGLSSGLGWHRADPVLGLLVVVVILASVRAIVLKALDVLLDRELTSDSRKEILAIARAHEEVVDVHDLRTRTSGAQDFIQFHIELDPDMKLTRAHEITDEIEAALHARFPRAEIIIHADPQGIDDAQDRY